MLFRLHSLRFQFVARDAVRFPEGKPGNVLRGALGTIFRKIACDPACPGAKECERRASCAYARVFEPSAIKKGPSGFADWPRPFVFRAGHLDGTTAAPGESFHFDLHLFETTENVAPHFVRAFRELADEGLGPGRGRADLISVHHLDRNGGRGPLLYDRGEDTIREPDEPLAFSLEPVERRITRLRVDFTTPTELKSGNQLAEEPGFPVLFSRARDRISTLRALYQDGPLEIDFREMGRRAERIRTIRCEVQWRDVTRRSTRTGQVHPIGGFAGEAEYEGELAEFHPYLHLAQWTGVGRHTVWGKGAIKVRRID